MSGSDPLSWLEVRSSVLSLVRALRSGIDPVNRLVPRSSILTRVSAFRFGIVPLNWLVERRSVPTLPSSSRVTPCQEERGWLLSQLVLRLQLAPSVELYNATRAPRSVFAGVGVTVGVGVAVGVAVGSAVAVGVSAAFTVADGKGGPRSRLGRRCRPRGRPNTSMSCRAWGHCACRLCLSRRRRQGVASRGRRSTTHEPRN